MLIDDCEELTGFAYRVKQKSSESSVDLSPLSTGKGAYNHVHDCTHLCGDLRFTDKAGCLFKMRHLFK